MRHFEADKPTADNHDILHPRHHVCYAARIIQTAQRHDTFKSDARNVRDTRAGASGEHQFRPSQDDTVVKSDSLVSERNAIDAATEKHLNIVIAIGVFRAKHQNTTFRSFQIRFG